MSRRPLVPEPQLMFSAELAATVGLEEAVLLQQVRGLYLHQPSTQRDGVAWLHVSEAYLMQLLPFWSAADLRRVCASLATLGLLNINTHGAAQDSLLLAINEPADKETSTATPPEQPSPRRSEAPAAVAGSKAAIATTNTSSSTSTSTSNKVRPRRGEGEPLPHDFMPSEDMLEILEQFHGVPRGFALQQLEDFTLYWRERGSAGHAWQNKFKQHVQFQWARHQQERTGGDHAEVRGTGTARRTRDSSLEHDLTDTSWAD